MCTPQTFRQLLPEFADPAAYPEPVIEFWRGLADRLLNKDRWGDLLEYGTALYIAHHLVIGRRDKQAALAGGTPGEVKGPLSSRTVDKVTNSWDAKAVARADAGFWNATSYGARFYQLAQIVGAGGMQL